MKGLTNKIRHWLAKEAASSTLLPSAAKDARQHERYALCSLEAAFVTRPSGQTLPVLNISYGGFAAPAYTDTNPPPPTDEVVTLTFLGDSITTRVQKIYTNANLAGYRFTHDDTQTLVFLRDILEALHYGFSLHNIDKKFLKEHYHSPEWVCLRGEGPTDLSLRVDEQGEACEFLCTFRNGEYYFELRLKDGRLSTGKTIDRQGVGSRIQPSLDLDRTTLRSAILIFLGISDQKIIKALKPTIDKAAAHLREAKQDQ